MSIRTEARTLTCELTEDELLLRGDEMAKTYIQVAALDMQKKSLTAKIKPLDERIQELVTIIDTKTEERRVECRWVYSYDIGIKALIRPDTGEEIETGRIKDYERQQQFELETTQDCQQITKDVAEFNRQAEVDEDLALGAEDKWPTVCINKDCTSYSEEEANNCLECEHVYECSTCIGEVVEEVTADELAEIQAGEGLNDGEPVGSICATCVSNSCGGLTPTTNMLACDNFSAVLTLTQTFGRDKTCARWKTCDYGNRCFSAANEEEGNCLEDQAEESAKMEAHHAATQEETQTEGAETDAENNEVADSDVEPVEKEFACKVCGFDGGTKVYLSRHVEREHNLTMSQYKKQFPANATALQLAREKRAKLIKGAK